MDLSSSSSLDSLATTGVIDFDADAYVKGVKPRYVGNPNGAQYSPLDQPINSPANFGINGGAHLAGHPESDAFVKNYNEKKENEEGKKLPQWQTWLAGGLIATLALYIGSKIKKHIDKNPDFLKGIKTRLDNLKNDIKNLLNGSNKKPEAKVEAKAEQATETKKGLIAKLRENFMKLPKKGRIGIGVGAGLLGLYAIFKAKSGNNEVPQE